LCARSYFGKHNEVLIYQGVDLDRPRLILGDHMSVVFQSSFPSRVLEKKHNAIAHHRVQEDIAVKILRFAFVKSEENTSDILAKTLSNEKFHDLAKKSVL
jgi:hypothetical protein